MQKLIECVPNFSDGRHPSVYNTIADAIRQVPNIRVLDVSADPDHNRTVITFVGTPESIVEGAFQGIKTAARLINLEQHRGEHPRLGATDVCPFIPIRGVTQRECVKLAHQLAKRVGEELQIATYLYGFAATRPDRRNLADIRQGEYELWKSEIGQNPSRHPDYGPAKPAQWGATVIGVRPFLIAYNIFLNSDDAEIARAIARNVRASSGGLMNIQAKGFLVDGQAQVSMNLLNVEETPIHRVQEMVRQEAAYYGLHIVKAELVGLTPQKAFMDAARWYLQVHDMKDDQVLEYQLMDLTDNAEIDELTPRRMLDAMAATTPTPAGGSAAALVGALAAALTQMVAGLTMGRQEYTAVQAEANAVLDDAAELREQLTSAIAEDARAFQQFMEARRRIGLEPEDREEALKRATFHVAEVPLKVARLSRDVTILAHSITQIGNANAVTDAAAAAILARAAVQTAVLTVRINVKLLPEAVQANKWRREVESIEQQVNQLVEEVTVIAAKRGGF